MSPAVFKTDTTAVKVVGWVRFPDAPAIFRSAHGRFLVVLLTAASLALVTPAPALRGQEPEPPPAGQDSLPPEEDAEGDPVAAEGEEGQAEEGGAVDQAEEADQAAPDRERPVSPAGASRREVPSTSRGGPAASS